MVPNFISLSLGECCDITTGFPFKSSRYVEDENSIKLLRGDNIIQGSLRWEGVKRWDPSQLTNDLKEKYSLLEQDIVLAMDRPWIEAGLKYASINYGDLPCLLVQRVSRIRAKKNLHQRFLKYVIGDRRFTSYILSIQTGTTVPHISSKQIAEYQFSYPPIDKQKVIANILGTLDERIELNKKTNETLEEIAKALFKSWFIDFDPVKAKLEGRSTGLPDAISNLFPDSFEDSKLGKIPCGWKIQSLESLSKLSSGKRPKSRLETKTLFAKYPLYGGAGPMGFTNEFLIKGRKIITTGRVGTLGKFFRIKDPVWISDNALIIEPSYLFYNYCFYRLLNFDITIFNRGSTQPLITQSDLKKIEVICADEKIHKLFEILCSDFFEQFHKNQNESNTLGNLRDSLLPKLISGELRITDTEKMIEKVSS